MAKKLSGAEARYSRFKILMRDPSLSPADEGEVRAISQKLRQAARAKYFGTGIAGFIAGILTLLLIVGFLILPVSIIVLFQGFRELRYLRMCEERYIENREWEKNVTYS